MHAEPPGLHEVVIAAASRQPAKGRKPTRFKGHLMVERTTIVDVAESRGEAASDGPARAVWRFRPAVEVFAASTDGSVS